MGTCVHFSRSLPSNSWWQTMVGWQVLSRPSADEGGGGRPAFTGLATQPYSATEVDGWQHKLTRVSQNRAAVQRIAAKDKVTTLNSTISALFRIIKWKPNSGALFTDRHDSIFENARLEPFLDQVEDARVGDPVLYESHQPGLADFIEKALDVDLEYPVHLCSGDPDHQGVQRIVLAALGAEPIRKSEEVLLVDRIQHRGSRPLDDLVFEGGNRDWTLSAVWF